VKFSLIDPSVLDVYFQTLRINDLGSVIDKYEEEEIPVDLRLEIDDAARLFALAEKRALDILGSREILNEQLNKLDSQKGSS
jgi:hypothetical protein